jgi:hypothetical protein
MTNFLDAEMPRAIAALQRMAAALDKYTSTAPPQAAGSESSSTVAGADTPSLLDGDLVWPDLEDDRTGDIAHENL